MNQLPEGWRTVQLSEVALSIGNGVFARRPNDAGNGERILRISAVRNGAVDLGDCRYVEGVTREQLAKFTVSAGDLLLTRYNGSRHLVGTSGVVQPHCETVLHPDKLIRVVVDPEAADPTFVNYQLQSSGVRAFLEPRIRTTAGQSGISGRDVRAVPLALPSLDEQRRIVDILEDHLSRLAAAEGDTARAEAGLRVLRLRVSAAAFEELSSTYGTQPLLDHADIENGQTPRGLVERLRTEPTEDSVPFFKVGDMNSAEDRRMSKARFHVSDVDAAVLGLHVRRPGVVLLPKRGGAISTNKKRVLAERGAYDLNTMGLRPRSDLSVDFLWHWLMGVDLGRIADGSNVPQINAQQIRKLRLPVPPLSVQEAAVDALDARLETVTRLETVVTASTRRARALRSALLATAFSGRLTGRSSDLDLAEELIDA